MGLRYRVPLPGPFYYSGRVGPKRWLPRSSNTGSVLRVVLDGAPFAVESSEVPAGHSVFSCSAAWVAASGTGPCLEVVWFRPGPVGARGCGG